MYLTFECMHHNFSCNTVYDSFSFSAFITKMPTVKRIIKNLYRIPDRWIHSINWSIQNTVNSRHYFHLCRSLKNGMQPTESVHTHSCPKMLVRRRRKKKQNQYSNRNSLIAFTVLWISLRCAINHTIIGIYM